MPVINFSVASNRTWTGVDGEKHESTIWYRVSTWRRTAAVGNQYLSKGRQLIECLREIGAAAETATGGELAELDEEAGVIHETLSALLIELLVEAGLVQPLVSSGAS